MGDNTLAEPKRKPFRGASPPVDPATLVASANCFLFFLSWLGLGFRGRPPCGKWLSPQRFRTLRWFNSPAPRRATPASGIRAARAGPSTVKAWTSCSLIVQSLSSCPAPVSCPPMSPLLLSCSSSPPVLLCSCLLLSSCLLSSFFGGPSEASSSLRSGNGMDRSSLHRRCGIFANPGKPCNRVKKMGDEKTTSLSQFPSNALGSAALVAKGPG